MFHLILLALMAVVAMPPRASGQTETPEGEEASSGPGLDTELSELGEALDFSQKEQQERFDFGVGLNMGPVLPWNKWGLSFLWQQKYGIGSVSVGLGDFTFSDNYRDRNYRLEAKSQTAVYALRFFPLGFGPIYFEPLVGLGHWKGDIQPQGDDPVLDELASSLSSRYDLRGLSLGAHLGLMWIFSNRFFIDYNLFGVSKSYFFNEYYSVNTSEARANIREQVGGPLSFSNAHLRVGWSWIR